MKIELKKVKYHEDMSDETCCFSAEVWAGGRLVATAQNQGCGGDTMVHPAMLGEGLQAFKELKDHCKSLPPTRHVGDGYDFTTESDMESVVDGLFYEWLKAHEAKKAQAQIRRWCRKETLFRLKGDKEGSWRTINRPYTGSICTHIMVKYGDRLEEIANQRFLTA